MVLVGLMTLRGEAGEALDVDGAPGVDHEVVAVGPAVEDLEVAVARGVVAGLHDVGSANNATTVSTVAEYVVSPENAIPARYRARR